MYLPNKVNIEKTNEIGDYLIYRLNPHTQNRWVYGLCVWPEIIIN
jgi:hypothetical protein